jgi:adenylate kinase
LAESKRVIIVGIPGVGKTTVVSKVVKLLKEKK